MTLKRDLKLLARARMKKTGESYMAARRNVLHGGCGDESLPPPIAASEPEPIAVNEPEPIAASECKPIAAGESKPIAVSKPVTWHPRIETSADEAQALLDIALSSEPRLTYCGIGILDETSRRVRAAISRRGLEDIEREFADERDLLSNHLDQIAACADWITRQRRTASYNTRHTSYGYKHLVERWIDGRGGPHLYIANGSFIAAALGLGYEGRPDEFGSPNLHFKFSERTVRKLG
jgi:hypothetical protein